MEQSPKSYFMCSSMGQCGWMIFILDLSGDDRRSSSVTVNRSPTVRLDGKFFSNWYFCIVGSTLYGFEGVDILINDCGGKMIYKFELPSDDEANLELETYIFTPVCEMMDRKFFPGAVASPSGRKIIIFSGLKNRTSFELFDVVGGFCSRLRSVPTVAGGNAHIGSRCFISETEFVLGMEHGMFKINIGHRDPRWKSLNSFYGGKLPRSYYKVIGNDLCVTPACAYSILGLDCVSARRETGEKKAYDSMYRWNYFYPDASAIHCDYEKHVTASIIVLSSGGGDNGGFCEFCVLKAGENLHTEEEVMVTLDVYRCSLSECRIELLRNSEMEDVLAQEKMEKMGQIRKWWEELYRGGECDPMKWVEYYRERDSLTGRELRPLPCTILRMSYCFTFKANEFYLRDFSFIPREM